VTSEIIIWRPTRGRQVVEGADLPVKCRWCSLRSQMKSMRSTLQCSSAPRQIRKAFLPMNDRCWASSSDQLKPQSANNTLAACAKCFDMCRVSSVELWVPVHRFSFLARGGRPRKQGLKGPQVLAGASIATSERQNALSFSLR